MALSLIALFIHPREEVMEKVSKLLWPEVQFQATQRVNSIPEGFQQLVESNFNICFLHSSFNKDIDAFFRDMSKLGRDKSCAFVQLWDMLPKGFNSAESIANGFAGVITEDISPEERKVLHELLSVEFHRQEVDRRVKDVSEAVGLLVKEVDRVASERQRGRPVTYDQAIRSFVRMQAEFDDDILQEYFQVLSSEAGGAQSFERKEIKIPSTVLRRKLPCLTENKYSGISVRVWTKLLKKYGIQPDGPLLEGEKSGAAGKRDK